jgi:hypothetical protein
MTVVLSFFFFCNKKKELKAMNSYANSDALPRTLGVVKEKETKKGRVGKAKENKKQEGNLCAAHHGQL